MNGNKKQLDKSSCAITMFQIMCLDAICKNKLSKNARNIMIFEQNAISRLWKLLTGSLFKVNARHLRQVTSHTIMLFSVFGILTYICDAKDWPCAIFPHADFVESSSIVFLGAAVSVPISAGWFFRYSQEVCSWDIKNPSIWMIYLGIKGYQGISRMHPWKLTWMPKMMDLGLGKGSSL